MGKKNETVKALQAIYKRDGILTAEALVRDAKSKKHPLHDKFEWDNTIAGHKYRLQQGRNIISVTVIDEDDEDNKTSVTAIVTTGNKRAFVSLKKDRKRGTGGGYRAVSDVVASKSLKKNLIQDALDELDQYVSKWQNLPELKVVISAINRAKAKVKL